MKKAHEKRVTIDFDVPPGILEVEIDPKSGLLAYDGMENSTTEYFIEGTEPTEEALPEEVVGLDAFMLEQAAALEQDTDTEQRSAVPMPENERPDNEQTDSDNHAALDTETN